MVYRYTPEKNSYVIDGVDGKTDPLEYVRKVDQGAGGGGDSYVLTKQKIIDALGFEPTQVDPATGDLVLFQLPPIPLGTVYVVNSQAAMLALSAIQGDFAVRTDLSKTFVLKQAPAATLANWVELLFAASVTSVNGQTGAVTITLGQLLPSQTGQAGKVLKTDGSNASWQVDATGGGGTGSIEYLNVLDYGAVADMVQGGTVNDPTFTGGTDNTAAFQAALDAQFTTKKTIYVPPGAYRIAGALTYKCAPRIRGSGMDTTILVSGYQGGPLLASNTTLYPPGSPLVPGTNPMSSSGTLLEHFQVKGPGRNVGTTSAFFDSQRTQVNWQANINNIFVRDFAAWGIRISDSYDNNFENCRFWFIGNTGGSDTNVVNRRAAILLDRVTWENENFLASTGNRYENISIQRCVYGIAPTSGNQIAETTFQRVTCEFCGWGVFTHGDELVYNANDLRFQGNNLFNGVYCEANFVGGMRSYASSFIECYQANFPGAGANYADSKGAYFYLDKGSPRAYAGGNPSTARIEDYMPAFHMWNSNTDFTKEKPVVRYNPVLHAVEHTDGAERPVMLLWNGPATSPTAETFVTIRDAGSTILTPGPQQGLAPKGHLNMGDLGARFTFDGTKFIMQDFKLSVPFGYHESLKVYPPTGNAQVLLKNATANREWILSSDTSKSLVIFDATGNDTIMTFRPKNAGDVLTNNGQVDIQFNLAVGGNLSIGGTTTLSGNTSIVGNMNVTGTFTAGANVISGASNPSLTIQNTSATPRNWALTAANGKSFDFYDATGLASVASFRAKGSGIDDGCLYLPYGIEFEGGAKIVRRETGGAAATAGTFTFDTGTVVGTRRRVVVSNTKVTANSRIHLTIQNTYGATSWGSLAVVSRVAGTSFTVESSLSTDACQVYWSLVEP